MISNLNSAGMVRPGSGGSFVARPSPPQAPVAFKRYVDKAKDKPWEWRNHRDHLHETKGSWDAASKWYWLEGDYNLPGFQDSFKPSDFSFRSLEESSWYVDHYQDETVEARTVVSRCPRGMLIIPVLKYSHGMTAYLMGDAIRVGKDELRVKEQPDGLADLLGDGILEALRSAAHEAKKVSEEGWEESIKNSAGMDMADLLEELMELNGEARATIRDIRNRNGAQASLARLLNYQLKERRELHRKIEKLRNDPWSVQY